MTKEQVINNFLKDQIKNNSEVHESAGSYSIYIGNDSYLEFYKYQMTVTWCHYYYFEIWLKMKFGKLPRGYVINWINKNQKFLEEMYNNKIS